MENSPNQIGLIGLGVMGQNLARNIANHGFKIVVFNRTTAVAEEYIKNFGSEKLVAEYDLEKFIKSIERPRKIIILVEAGPATDSVIAGILPFIEKDDIIIDCGNSDYKDTIRREQELAAKGISFIGSGVSGGEEGALNGPSLMPGGKPEAWEQIKPIWEAIAARDFNEGACVTLVGENGAGHFVKMVHNGIEYGVMQIIAEAYDLLSQKLTAPEIATVFAKLNEGKLKSYLFEISVKVLNKKDEFSDAYLVDNILDEAAQKGTGKLTVMKSLESGASTPTIAEAVFARAISANKNLRTQLSQLYPFEKKSLEINIEQLESAIYAAMLSTYAQGLDLIITGAKLHNWNINLAEVCRIWEGGCIIRAEILKVLHEAYSSADQQQHLFAIPSIHKDLQANLGGLRLIISTAVTNEIPVPALSSAMAYFDSVTKEKLPANFVQGLRDYFGAHTYKRTDKEGTFHTKWS